MRRLLRKINIGSGRGSDPGHGNIARRPSSSEPVAFAGLEGQEERRDIVFENLPPLLFDDEPVFSSLVSPFYEKPHVDPNTATSTYLRHGGVQDLTGRVSATEIRSFFENRYSNVWTVKLDHNRLIAIKCPKDLVFRYEQARRGLTRNTEVWWRLRHENVIPLLGIVHDDRYGYLGAMVTPWYKNLSVDVYLSNSEQPVSIANRIDLFYGVAEGIKYLHTFGTTKIGEKPASSEHEYEDYGPVIIHGDLQPRNVLIDDKGVPKLCDFGLRCLIKDNLPLEETMSNDFVTMRYLCYELVIEEENSTTNSDIYALACVGQELLYSTPPFATIQSHSPTSIHKLFRAIQNQVSPATRPEDTSGVLSTLWDIFEQSWSHVPRDRPDASTICEFLHLNRDGLVAAME